MPEGHVARSASAGQPGAGADARDVAAAVVVDVVREAGRLAGHAGPGRRQAERGVRATASPPAADHVWNAPARSGTHPDLEPALRAGERGAPKSRLTVNRPLDTATSSRATVGHRRSGRRRVEQQELEVERTAGRAAGVREPSLVREGRAYGRLRAGGQGHQAEQQDSRPARPRRRPAWPGAPRPARLRRAGVDAEVPEPVQAAPPSETATKPYPPGGRGFSGATRKTCGPSWRHPAGDACACGSASCPWTLPARAPRPSTRVERARTAAGAAHRAACPIPRPATDPSWPAATPCPWAPRPTAAWPGDRSGTGTSAARAAAPATARRRTRAPSWGRRPGRPSLRAPLTMLFAMSFMPVRVGFDGGSFRTCGSAEALAGPARCRCPAPGRPPARGWPLRRRDRTDGAQGQHPRLPFTHDSAPRPHPRSTERRRGRLLFFFISFTT